MRVLICGGRDYANRDRMAEVLGEMMADWGMVVLIHGGATGADRLACEWAESVGMLTREFPAKWKLRGRAAGPIRNQEMIDEGRPDFVVAFPGGRGTSDMKKRAKKAGLPVREVDH